MPVVSSEHQSCCAALADMDGCHGGPHRRMGRAGEAQTFVACAICCHWPDLDRCRVRSSTSPRGAAPTRQRHTPWRNAPESRRKGIGVVGAHHPHIDALRLQSRFAAAQGQRLEPVAKTGVDDRVEVHDVEPRRGSEAEQLLVGAPRETITGDRSTATTAKPSSWKNALSCPVPAPTSSSRAPGARRPRNPATPPASTAPW